MVEYPYDEDALLDRKTFDLFSKHFELIPNYERRSDGFRIFVYEEEKILDLSTPELIEISPHLLIYREWAFDGGVRREGNIDREKPDPKKIIELMQEREITRDIFVDTMINFELSILGNESSQPIAAIAADLDGENFFRNSCLIGDHLEGMISLNQENNQKCAEANRGRVQPFELEHILKIDAEPVAVDYANGGKLYLFDELGRLHEFTEGKKTNEWQVREGVSNNFYRDTMERIFSPVFPNISVRDNVLFFTNGSTLERHDLDEKTVHTKQLHKYVGDALVIHRDKKVKKNDIWFHDVCIKDGNVFVSASLRTHERYILQIVEDGKYNIVHQGMYPRDPMGSTNDYQDLTLRLGIFNAGLYFSEENGISLLTESGPKEMIGEYKRKQMMAYDIDPITKFSFGDDFMIASGTVRDFKVPMLQVFKPVYDQEGLIRVGEIQQPTRFERAYITDIPKNDAIIIQPMSIAAHGTQFAFTHNDWKRVFVYRMKE
jgi:hypothetical protein